MTKETRANLIFLAIFLTLVIPGGVIIFKKRLKSGRPLTMMGEAVRTQLPYMADIDAPTMERIAPELTDKFVRGIAAGQGVERLSPPVMSSDRHVELVGIAGGGPGGIWTLLIWDPTAIVSQKSDVKVSGGEVLEAETIQLPDEVSRELAYNGIVRVPHQVVRLKVDNPEGKPLQLTYQTRDGDDRHSVVGAKQ